MFDLEAKNHLLKESRRDSTGPESANEGASASTRARAKKDASLGVEATLTDREPHQNMSCANCILIW